MKTVGIVCEYNPFHMGHKHQIDILRENGAETVICAMSGNYTQRGELAIADKYTRARAAVNCGADIVLELPFPFSSLSAEGFARAGVHILSNVGCDTVSFGSECADIDLLMKAANAIASEEFISSYSTAGKELGAAKAYFDTLKSILGCDVELLSNDILAISYLSAIKRLNCHMDVFPVHRKGDAYRSVSLGEEYPSATAIRRSVSENSNSFDSLDCRYLPEGSLEALKDAQKGGNAPVFQKNAEREILSFFRLLNAADINARAISRSMGGTGVADDGCGIVERICNSARESDTLEEMLSRAYNSRYTDARINRILLFSLFGISDAFSKAVPCFSTLLAASENGRRYLANIRKSASFPIVTKPADAPEGALADVWRSSDSFYAFAMGKKQDHFIKMHPFMA